MSGRIGYYGGIVKDGLVLNLDAGKKDSYNRVGTAWNDISGNAYNGTLTNNPLFNINNGGYFQFDGTDDFVTLGNVSNLGFTNGIFTIESWIYVPSTWTAGSQYPNIISKGATAGWDTDGWSLFCFRDYPSSGQFTWGFGMRNSGVVNSRFRYTLPTNQYIQAVAVINGAVDTTLYENGVFNKTGVNTLTPASNSTSVLVGADAGVPRQSFPGRISVVRIYNRVLSATEVLQNYNALKGRFNL